MEICTDKKKPTLVRLGLANCYSFSLAGMQISRENLIAKDIIAN